MREFYRSDKKKREALKKKKKEEKRMKRLSQKAENTAPDEAGIEVSPEVSAEAPPETVS